MNILSLSGGKDSVATLILCIENNIQVDEVIFSEVMFDEEISGELPEHIEFIDNVIRPYCIKNNITFTKLRSDKTYMDCFNHKPVRGKWYGSGLCKGFPMSGKCVINRDCKVKPIRQYLNGKACSQIIGIACDEYERIKRLTGNKRSILYEMGITEKEAYKICKDHQMLSPIYNFCKRGGCWFCPNAHINEIYHLYIYHRDLFKKLVDLEHRTDLIGNMWNSLSNKRIEDLYYKCMEYREEIKRNNH